MKIETTTTAFRDALKAVTPIIEPRNTIPILGAVKIEGGKLTGTDLDMQVTASVAGDASPEGSAVLARPMLSVLRHVDDEPVTLQSGDGLADLHFNGATYQLPEYAVADFPDWRKLQKPKRTALHNVGLAAALQQVRFAVHTEETRYYLNGVCVSENADGTPVLVATDGHRLAMKPIPYGVSGSHGAIIPRKAVDYIISRRAEPQSCLFATKSNLCCFEWPGLTLDSKLIDGTYPDWKRVVPDDLTNVIEFKPSDWLPSIRRLRLISNTRQRASKITITSDSALIEVNSIEMKGAEKVAADWPERTPALSRYEVGFNLNYLLDALTQFAACETVTISGSDPGGPHIMRGEESDLMIVIMPMRV